MVYARVMALGNDAVIALPERWRKANGIKVGDKVAMGFPTSSTMTIEPVSSDGTDRADRAEALLKLRKLVQSETAGIRFPQSKDEVRAILADRND